MTWRILLYKFFALSRIAPSAVVVAKVRVSSPLLFRWQCPGVGGANHLPQRRLWPTFGGGCSACSTLCAELRNAWIFLQNPEALRRARNWLHELLRQSDATDEIHKPWIVTERLESTSSFEIRKLRVALLVSLFHPDESLIQVTQGSIENGD